MGTDDLGRDVLSRDDFWGSLISLSVGFVSVGIATLIGISFLGAISGYYGGWVDSIIMRFSDIMPTQYQHFFLILAVIAFIDANIWSSSRCRAGYGKA